jgi:Zn-dependent protease/CBS domain-containing protein
MGQIAGIDITVRASWLLIAGLIALMLAPSIEIIAPGLGSLAYVAGLAFAVLLYVSVLLHELSHALAAKAFGLPVKSVTLHFLGGVTEIDGEPPTAWREFVISVVGPLTSLLVGGLAWLVGGALSEGLLGYAVGALARANLLVGVLNLAPGLPLDGGRMLRAAVWGATGKPQLGTLVAGWSGRVIAALVLCFPLFLQALTDEPVSAVDFAIAFILAIFLWTSASQALAGARIRAKLPNLQARQLARRAIAVPHDLPLAEGIRRARDAQAGGLVVVTGEGEPIGVVNETAVLSTPEARRPWVSCGSVARKLESGLRLDADLAGEPLVRALRDTPATEYLLVEPSGQVFGVLTAKDVDAAFTAA